MRILMVIILLFAGYSSAMAESRSRANWKALEVPAEMAPAPARRAISALADTVRVLIAGDSWAQYMWDDGVHNELLDRFGLADRRALSQSLGSNPGPGSSSSAYAVSGSEAREWADPANFPWTANLVNALQLNPHADTVFLSIGGNDILAGQPDGG